MQQIKHYWYWVYYIPGSSMNLRCSAQLHKPSLKRIRMDLSLYYGYTRVVKPSVMKRSPPDRRGSRGCRLSWCRLCKNQPSKGEGGSSAEMLKEATLAAGRTRLSVQEDPVLMWQLSLPGSGNRFTSVARVAMQPAGISIRNRLMAVRMCNAIYANRG